MFSSRLCRLTRRYSELPVYTSRGSKFAGKQFRQFVPAIVDKDENCIQPRCTPSSRRRTMRAPAEGPSSQNVNALLKLRELILSGELKAGERLSELASGGASEGIAHADPHRHDAARAGRLAAPDSDRRLCRLRLQRARHSCGDRNSRHARGACRPARRRARPQRAQFRRAPAMSCGARRPGVRSRASRPRISPAMSN